MHSRSTLLSTNALRLLMVLAAVAASLLIVEKIARTVAPYPMVSPWMGQINGVIAPLPGVHGRHFVPGLYDTTFSFTSQRFRGQTIFTQEPGSQVIRIAALGASFTFGSGANDVEAYPFRLQSILQEESQRLGWNHSIEVINAGIPGSVIAEQSLWYENWVKSFHPDVVILNVSCAADHLSGLFQLDSDGTLIPRPKEAARSAGANTSLMREIVHHFPGLTLLAEHSEAFNVFRVKESEVLRRKTESALGANVTLANPTDPPPDFIREELRYEAAEVRWLKHRVQQTGATFVIVALPCRENIYPSQSQWTSRIRKEYPMVVNTLRDLTDAESILFTEVSPLLMEKAKQGEPLYYNGEFETHPNPAGYRAIAAAVAAFLVERRIVPEGCGIRCSPRSSPHPGN